MNKKVFLFQLIFLSSVIVKTTIKHIFIDPNVIFTTNENKAADYVGRWEALKYTSTTGHFPSQKYFFQDLQNVPAKSNVITYDEELQAPLIISDWLLGTPTEELASAIKNYLDESLLSQTEKNIYTNIANMMFNGKSLARVQKVRKKIEHFLQKLKSQKYSIYFVGNWAEIEPLKEQFPQIFKYIDHLYISSEHHHIKPEIDFWAGALSSQNINPEECLCIEAEPIFYKTVSQSELSCKSVLYNPKKLKQLSTELQSHGVQISL